MCREAEELFEEYHAAVEAPADNPDGERRIRNAMKMLTRHNAHHHCCAALRFELSTTSGSTWKFYSKACRQSSH
jgi:hypothetical protein